MSHYRTRKTYNLCLVGTLLILVSGCARTPTVEDLAKADYGAPISQAEAEAKASAFLKRHLKDPDSAKIEWGTVQTGWIRDAPINGGQLRFGYVLDANINAKNSYGAYSGYKPYKFLFFNSSLVSAYAQQELRDSYGSTPYMGIHYRTLVFC